MAHEHIKIRGARTHNLKNINLDIPRDKFVVITGLSGSGKSSLAFDTLYAEGQRRYVESLSAYARQFLSQMDKPEVDSIEGLSPAIAIEQKSTNHNPRSTVGTITEIYDYLRLLYARVGTPYCPVHDEPMVAQTITEMVDDIMALPADTKLMILAPVVRDRKGEHIVLLEQLVGQGFVRVRVDGNVYDMDELPALEKNKKHSIEVVVDRFKVRDDLGNRVAESLETALRLGNDLAILHYMDGNPNPEASSLNADGNSDDQILSAKLCLSTRKGVGTTASNNIAITAKPTVNQNRPEISSTSTNIGPNANANMIEVAMVRPIVAIALVRDCSVVTSASSAINTADTAPLPASARPMIT